MSIPLTSAVLTARTRSRVPDGYAFDVPLLDGDHVTDDTGTGFVHTAPGHGREDFDIWMAQRPRARRTRHRHAHPLHGRCGRLLHRRGAGLRRQARHRRQGQKGDANEAVIEALIAAGNIVARGRLKHQYPHSWRSKKPVIFRNTPQWFIAMDKPFDRRSPGGACARGGQAGRDTLRDLALEAIGTRAGCRRRARTASPA